MYFTQVWRRSVKPCADQRGAKLSAWNTYAYLEQKQAHLPTRNAEKGVYIFYTSMQHPFIIQFTVICSMHFMHQDKHALCMLKGMILLTPQREETLENLIHHAVTIYGAVNDARGCLVNCNKYVAFFTDTGEVKTK